jgi:hypothetical protein
MSAVLYAVRLTQGGWLGPAGRTDDPDEATLFPQQPEALAACATTDGGSVVLAPGYDRAGEDEDEDELLRATTVFTDDGLLVLSLDDDTEVELDPSTEDALLDLLVRRRVEGRASEHPDLSPKAGAIIGRLLETVAELDDIVRDSLHRLEEHDAPAASALGDRLVAVALTWGR